MGRRRAAQIPHREFFRAVTLEETVVLACTCSRGVDHWYGGAQRVTGRAPASATPSDDALEADSGDADADAVGADDGESVAAGSARSDRVAVGADPSITLPRSRA